MLINTKTQVRISEFDFKEAHPDSAFPAILTDAILELFDVAVLNYGVQPTPTANQKVIDDGNEFIDGEWRIKWSLTDKSADELLVDNVEFQKLVTQRIQQRLDSFAQDRGYDDIVSICTYAGTPPDNATSTQLKFNSEGNYAVSIRSLTWAVLTDFMNEVKAGTKAMPSDYSEIEVLLPELSWPD